MATLLRHRGPDDEGYCLFSERGEVVPLIGADTPSDVRGADATQLAAAPIEGYPGGFRAGFAHRRLSIIDRSGRGHQPMAYNGRYWIVYNGEIYNYRELRHQLEAEGYAFSSHCDTEVILAAYQKWGAECCSRLNGMWAFAIYDRESHSVFLSRDQYGIKPLYYWVFADGGVSFASEIKAFTALDCWRSRPNRDRLFDFLVWGLMDHTDETMFAGVFQLTAGSSATIQTNGSSRLVAGQRLPAQRWYSWNSLVTSQDLRYPPDKIKELLVDSVRLRLRADVAVGSCLSGGLDSSAVVCIANELLRKGGQYEGQKTFTLGSEVAKYDERRFAQAVAERIQVDAHYLLPRKSEVLRLLPDLIWSQDEPFGSSSIFAQWCVFEAAAREQVKVMLDGQGADEIFCGYPLFFGPRLAGLLRTGRMVEFAREWTAIRRLHGFSSAKLGGRLAVSLFPGCSLTMSRLLQTGGGRLDWLDLEKLGAKTRDALTEYGARGSSLGDVSLSQVRATSLPMLLHWEDRNSMAHSVEARLPFLDHRLVETVIPLADDWKVKRGVTKVALRSATAGLVPELVRARIDKLGFATAELEWLRGHATEFRSSFRDAVASTAGILTDKAITRFEGVIAGTEPFCFWSWRCICFGAWCARFKVQF
ncbi:MAG: asparagine synthase (glutamine-hydrolyzing) [Verrucomicrobiota bacterium]